jgi:alginate O-acetyltransferase complex protein AlgI
MLQGNQVGAGVYRICRGMAKKLLVADVVRVSIVDPVFSDPDRFTGPELLIALYAYTLQIYCDFSGYTDMAIGSARLFGIELPENFKAPYRATSVAEFWRRWHLTLSNWVRDYIYYPLGGARADKDWKVYRNLMLTMLIIGVWHGASINFVVYGTLHGLAQCINRFQRKRTGRKPGDPLPGAWAWAWRWALTFHFVVLARILFRAKDLAAAQEVLTGLLDPTFLMPRFSPLAFAVLGLGYASHFLPESWSTRAEAAFRRQHPLVWVVAAALVAVAVKRLSTGDDLAFVYYQF